MSELDSSSVSSEFLIAEFNALHERAMHLEEMTSSRVNFLLIVYAATLAILPSIFENFPGVALLATLLIALIVMVIGIMSLNQVVFYSTSVVVFYRRAGRIRRWFVEQSPEITSYVAFLPRDDRPLLELKGSGLVLRGADGVLLALNSVSVGVACLCVVLFFQPVPAWGFPVLIASIAMPIAWFAQWQWIRRIMREESERLAREVHFGDSEQLRMRYEGDS